MSIMAQLEFAFEFSESEKKLSKYILDEGVKILDLNSRDLASKTYTSPATIVRLCQKIGLKGYSEFKIKYSAELQADLYKKDRINVNYPFKTEDSTETVCHNLMMLHRESIEDTFKLIDIENLNKVVSVLYNSKKINIYGSGNSVIAGLTFQHKMMRIGREVIIKTISGEQIPLSYNLKKEDAAIFISYTGESNELITIAQIAKTKKTPIIIITSIGDNALSRMSDYVINICSKEKIYNKIAPYASKMSMDYILDIIFSLIFKKDYDENIKFKISMDTKYDKRNPHSPINEK